MIVGKQDSFYVLTVDTIVVKCLSEFAHSYSCIDEDGGIGCTKVVAVATTATTKG